MVGRKRSRTDRLRAIRSRLYAKAGGLCHWCGRLTRLVRPGQPAPLAPYHATLDHLTPRCLGGPSEPRNLVLACYECNHERGNSVGSWRRYR